jgi:hypothetical protein
MKDGVHVAAWLAMAPEGRFGHVRGSLYPTLVNGWSMISSGRPQPWSWGMDDRCFFGSTIGSRKEAYPTLCCQSFAATPKRKWVVNVTKALQG